MGKITDMNTRALENAENYDDAKLNGLFDAKEFCTELSNLINSKGLKIDEILDHWLQILPKLFFYLHISYHVY